MFEELQARGEWWLPSDPDNRIHGTLNFTTLDGARLSLSGKLSKTRGHFTPNFIHGITLDGRLVTLYGCERLHTSELPFAGIAESEYYAAFIFSGIHFRAREDLLLSGIHIHYTHLDEWLHKFGFTHDRQDPYDFIIKYKRPENIVADVSDEIKVSIGFTFREGGTLYSIYAEQESYFSIRGPDSGYEYYEKYGELLQDFLSLACTAPVFPIKIRLSPSAGLSDNDDVELDDRFIDLYYQISTAPNTQLKIFNQHMLFTFSDVEERFEVFIRNWFTKYESFGPIYDLYFGAISNPYLHVNNKFLSIVQGLESYHRRKYDGTILPNDDFEKLKNEIFAASPTHKKWLKWKLKWANEPSLFDRLMELGDKYKEIIVPQVGAYDSFFKKVSATRNYLTHFDEKLLEKIVTGGELKGMIQTLTGFLEAILLNELGFDYEEVVDIQRHRKRLPYW